MMNHSGTESISSESTELINQFDYAVNPVVMVNGWSGSNDKVPVKQLQICY